MLRYTFFVNGDTEKYVSVSVTYQQKARLNTLIDKLCSFAAKFNFNVQYEIQETKVFAYVVETVGKGKRAARVYKIVDNIPHQVTWVEYSPGVSPGPENEAFRDLIKIGEIPEDLYSVSECSWRGSGYYCPEIEDLGYKIIRL